MITSDPDTELYRTYNSRSVTSIICFLLTFDASTSSSIVAAVFRPIVMPLYKITYDVVMCCPRFGLTNESTI